MNKDQRPHTQVASAFAERRKNPRTAIHRPAYINFEPYNRGGVITDISETGLRFHTVDTLEQGGIVRVSIFLGAASHIEAVGELMWKDATHRVGGLRFTVLPAGAADQMRNWAEASNGADVSGPVSRADASTEPPLPAENRKPASNLASSQPETAPGAESGVSESASQAKSQDLPQTQAQAPDPNTNTQSPWVPRSMRPASRTPIGQTRSQNAGALPPGQPWSPPATYQQPSAMPWITHFDPDPPAGKWSFVRGVLGGIIICIMLGWAGWFAASHNLWPGTSFQFGDLFSSHPAAINPAAPPPDVSSAQPPNDAPNDLSPANSQPDSQEALPSAGRNSPADTNVQSDSNAQAHPDGESAAGASAGRAKNAPPEVSGSLQTVPAQPPAAGLPASPTPIATRDSLPPASQQIAKVPAVQPAREADAGESQLTLARQYLDGRGHPRNPAAASQLLWSAVEKGNSTAETDLADLYLRGDGVTKNCDQARVLLSAASDKGNAEAMHKLTELNRTGCR